MRTKHTASDFKCDTCQKPFSRLDSLKRHQQKCLQKTYPCPRCERKFTSEEELSNHMGLCRVPTCGECGDEFATNKHLLDHKKSHAKRTAAATAGPSKRRRKLSSFHCRECNSVFDDRKQLFQHQIQAHEDPQLWNRTPEVTEFEDDELNLVIRSHRSIINVPHHIQDAISIYNFPLHLRLGNENWAPEIMQILEQVARLNSAESYKFNFNCGFVLINKETDEYRYFAPGSNNTFFKKPKRVDRPSDWRGVAEEITAESLMGYVMQQRENTKWLPLMLTNVTVQIYHLRVSMGEGDLPAYIKNSRSIVGLDRKHWGTHELYNDNKCAFRCLAYHFNVKAGKDGYDDLEQRTEEICREWGQGMLTLEELPHFENRFRVRIDIYNLCEDGAAVPVYLSEADFEDNLVLNLHDKHLSYVVNPQAYLQKWKCSACERHFIELTHWKRHRGHCAVSTVYEFPGKHHKEAPTIFDRLDEFGIAVPAQDRLFPWFAVYDFESVLIPCDEQTAKTAWIRRHEPVSVSICSNVRRDPQCFINQDQTSLIKEMMEYLGEISDEVYETAKQKWSYVFTQLEEMEKAFQPQPGEGEDVADIKQKSLEKLRALQGSFDHYCRQCPVVGFNSSNYDLNLVSSSLLKWLLNDKRPKRQGDTEDSQADMEDEDVRMNTIKKGNSYSQLATYRFKFLDISNFLAGGVSYCKFLKAYQIEEAKGYFPYEWFDSFDKLDNETLPLPEHFYSALKKKNTLGETEEEIQKNYEEVKSIWQLKNMKTFRQYLEHYNNLDVGPFVEAVEKMQVFYFDQDIDLLKVAISVPGVARKMAFKAAREFGAHFSLLHRNDDDLFYTLKKNVVGGPSIIFTRFAEANTTFIKEDITKPCQNITGWDANALYLYTIGQPQPCGAYVRRQAPNFKADARLQHEDMFHWMEYTKSTEQVNILHARNNIHEIRIGPYYVDGYDPQNQVVYEYNGCYFHGCSVCGKDEDEAGKKRKERTEERENYIRSQTDQVKEVRVIWEHEYKEKLKKSSVHYDPNLAEFVKQRLPPFYQKHKYDNIKESQLLTAVGNDELYGFLEVDIHVPDHLIEDFKEMPPLFCNNDVDFEDMGDFMKNYVRENKLSTKPRHLLISGMKAEKILLSSPYLKWLLDHGLVVTKIYQVVEYTPLRCFEDFVNRVSDARREGDLHADRAIIADTMKLIGNSVYGSFLMDKTKHQNTAYVDGRGAAQLKFNDPRFRKATAITEDMYELQMSKEKIVMDLPMQLGYNILQLAKLRMLEFKYDFMDKFCMKNTFEYLEMDTDSAYMALAGQKLEDIVMPSKRQTLLKQKMGHCGSKAFTAEQGFFPRECCNEHIKYDRRTPGLFKVEAEGTSMIALCSKTYILKQADDRVKFSCKGMNKARLESPYAAFNAVLQSGKPYQGTNQGFRTRQGTIYTYEQEKSGLAYFYCKREVLQDGIHTRPLIKTLSPWKSEQLDIVGEEHPWSLTVQQRITLNGVVYNTLAAVCQEAMRHPDPINLVSEAVLQMPEYRLQGKLLFPITPALKSLDYDFWHSNTYWTTGISTKATPLREDLPGQNMLAHVFIQSRIQPALREHNYA